jgi:hypothetical protein
MTRSLLLLSLVSLFALPLFANLPAMPATMADPCSGTYTGFYDGVGPVQFDFIHLNDDLIAVRLHYQGVVYQGQGFCDARGEAAKVSLTFENAPSHEGRIQRESDLLMFRGYQATDGLNFTTQKR